ncbi:transcription termination factor Rho [Corynebacterium atrinae]|uniref:transcription termination factor Rho n=1 Tax=Corynebacterium atrinae TaxID=1336740 RepID=UPI0025B2E9CD|nr:transcription termination factor Rho [Corynebacterium atrinae]
MAPLKLPELRKLAADRGLKGTSGLRKGDLIAAIQSGSVPAKARAEKADTPKAAAPTKEAPQAAAPAKQDEPAQSGDSQGSQENSQDGSDEGRYESRSAARRARRNRARHSQQDSQDSGDKREEQQQDSRPEKRDNAVHADSAVEDNSNNSNADDQRENREGRDNRGNRNNRNSRNDRNERNERNDRNDRNEDGEGRRGRRNRRNRRNRGGGSDFNDNNQQGNQQQDQHNDGGGELQDVAGILDILDNNAAFVRTTGYQPSSADVYVNNQLVRRFGLRSGDAVTGQVKMGAQQTHGQGRNRQKYNQLVRVETVNGLSVEEARNRPEFAKLTPLYPNQRLRLETDPRILTTRVIDLIMPIGKGQRALIVSPPKAGKTTIMQNIANAISTNNPECYLMVVLVDERPEEVTDMQRSVKGEVIASTFDRPPSEHTAIAELAIERAKRLVEQGKDVVVLLDSITRLGRAYNNSSPASGRILSGGVDSNALYPPKRFLGAARNIENGGSLTIIATAMVETGSAGDTVIFEEFKGTGNAELKLDRKISERRVFPAVDVNPSGTRKDELLLAPEEVRIMHKLRRILSALDPQQAIDLLIKQLKKSKSNGEFLMQVASSAPMAADRDEEDYS